MERDLKPELLDSLPPTHPDALHNRRDLWLTNQILGNYRWLVRTLPPLVRRSEIALELGAGTGELASRLARRGVAVDGLDLWPRPPSWPAARAWHVADIRTFTGYSDYEVIFGNLIFHQFSDAELALLGAKLRHHARVVVACEPCRRRFSQMMYRAVGPWFGANHVSLHDAHVSIAAGFRRDELPRALGFTSPEWSVSCSTTMFGLYRMVATRLGAVARLDAPRASKLAFLAPTEAARAS
jgi:SAM-dependent methyltransferase